MSIRKKFITYWKHNLLKNYKRISIALGTFMSVCVHVLIVYLGSSIPYSFHAILWALDAFLSVLLISFFGTKENGDQQIGNMRKVIMESDDLRGHYMEEYDKIKREQEKLKEEYEC